MTDDPRQWCAAALGRAVDGLEMLAGSGNNRLYRVRAGDRDAVLKVYLNQAEDTRDRIGHEVAALRFLMDAGVTCVPGVLADDRTRGLALYDWIGGGPIEDPRDADVDALVAFAATLRRLARAPGADALPDAQAHCFSPADTERQLAARLARLEAAVAGARPALTAFLDGVFKPALVAYLDRARGLVAAFDAPLARELRTLSPSDFGFHNALRGADGGVVFVDFEYFGWDDPVKMTADVMLHRGRPLGAGHRRRAAAGMGAVFSPDDAGFRTRLRALYPLYGLIWCLIALNEFLPERWARRVFAGEAENRAQAEARQLDEAQRLVRELNAGHDIDSLLT